MLDRDQIRPIVHLALDEDAPSGDVTSQVFIPVEAQATADLVAREPGVMAGVEVVEVVFEEVDPDVEVTWRVADGDVFGPGDVLATITGSARSILRGERIALNLIQRMCGIAAMTAEYVRAVAHTSARVVDTRKTTPGLRPLERHAVRCGGGHNHRYSLSEAVMAKDNHLALTDDVTAAIRAAREQIPHTMHLEVEVDRIDQIEPVLAGGVDTIMLDNFSVEELRQGVEIVGDRALVEASGGVRLDTIAAIAETGVDVISVGALTHSVRSLDIGLDVRLESASK
ncbi:MAG: carboxylating nicotinate-nucleotide diphosphorylase [Aeromicrobium sp.]|uniref:carboxylating nicotinate-nucleotide diphosphorylase n=1 Tax=Aeromicrobium sp. TaxID=1871063 RepID=UPI0039E4BF96